MPKLGPGKGRRGGGKLTSSFNGVAADPTKSNAYDSAHDTSNAFDGDDMRGSNFTTHGSAWGGVGK